MSNNDKKCVIFDLDGTLIDSYECVLRCVNKVLDSYSLPNVNIPLSLRTCDITEIFLKAKTIIQGRVSYTEFKHRFDIIHFDDCYESITIKYSVYNRLKIYYNNSYDIIILTNKFRPIANKICEYLFSEIPLKIIGRIADADIKSNYNIIMKEFLSQNIKIEQCLYYYGDSKNDELLSKQLKVPFIYVD